MQVIVITGSTRGIGYGLADEFLKRDCAVVISGRSRSSVDKAVMKLTEDHDPDCILGQPCDVSDYDQVQILWDVTVKRFGKVDYWINNAGMNLGIQNFEDIPPQDVEHIVRTNILGVMNGSHVALNGMRKQGHGQIFNMEGMGSDGRRHEGQLLYGMTKYGLRYFNDGLQEEAVNTPILIGTLRPGMVVTDMLVDSLRDSPQVWARVRRIFNIIADRVETVTPYLTDRILANTKHGARIAWLTMPKMLWRFLSSPFKQRDLFADFDL